MVGILRALLERPFLREQTAAVGAAYVDFAFRSTRWVQRSDADRLLASILARGPMIFCVWHGRQLMMARLWPRTSSLWVVGSTSRDGQLALAVARRFGLNTIERARKTGGSSALRTMIKVLRAGGSVGITPDGSRGPKMRVKPGVVELARFTGAPLVPAAFSCTNAISLRSWDRFMVPLPFGSGTFIVGAPVEVAGDSNAAELEQARLTLERRLNAVTAIADEAVGRQPTVPEEQPDPSPPRVSSFGQRSDIYGSDN
jgi:lysophospholipid acyltransferase (LPLAT)-like uncharacterized protein